jgi:hypothetical protein
MKTGLLIVVLLAALAASVVFAARAWTDVDAAIGWHGWIALALGSVLTLAVGGGLMALVFYSSRKGYDDVDRDV